MMIKSTGFSLCAFFMQKSPGSLNRGFPYAFIRLLVKLVLTVEVNKLLEISSVLLSMLCSCCVELSGSLRILELE